eukprot:TRINITY_DN1113_c0_g1_i1.p1 TRINITY_DN1113_c0_g1~~TRINITY_DN1113_c0_g1_i1.p1  ORF type:complete len:516 (+),score=122.37 TRINITY_DN1113_c0_g1_i1:26-1549(+)
MASRFFSVVAKRAARRGSASTFSSPAVSGQSFFRSSSTSSAALAVQDDRFLRYNSPVPAAGVDHTPLLRSPETKITVLPNGLRVASQRIPHAETATVGVWIDAGSRFESAESNGTAHFLEHMIFKGTKSRSVRFLEEEIENMGGHLNAFTSREQTTYYAKVMKKDVGAVVEILSDILQHSTFNAESINRERNVILREMKEVLGQTEEVVFDHLHATAFQHTPLGRTILGPEENIKNITKEHIADYMKAHYTPSRMVVAGAGAIDHDALVKLVEKSFSSLSSNPATAAELVKADPSVFTGSEIRIRDDDMPLAHVVVAVKGAAWTDPDAIPLMVMQTMLGSWNKQAGGGKHLGSELTQKVSANDLAESIFAFNTNYSDTGLFGVYAIASPSTLDDLAWSIMHEMTRMIYRVAEDDVARAKNQLKSSLALHMEGTTAVADDIGRQLLTYGRRMPLAELFARIDAVDVDTVKRVADRFIYDKDLAMVSMGPTQYLPDYNWFRRRTYWLLY